MSALDKWFLAASVWTAASLCGTQNRGFCVIVALLYTWLMLMEKFA